MSEGTNYEVLLADAERERETVAQELAGIDLMIAFLKKRLGRTDIAPVVAAVPDFEDAVRPQTQPPRFPRLSPDSFFKMSVPEAVTEYLNIVRKPQSARQITDALQSGGLTHRAKDLYQTVFPTLQRMKERGQ